MKCRKCSAGAVINLRQHRLALCQTHFDEWFLEHIVTTIRKYRMIHADDRLLVAVSGGKDSLGLWDVLTRLGYKADGVYIHLGIDHGGQYSAKSLEFTQRFAAIRGLTLHILDIQQEYGFSVPEIFKRFQNREEKPCSACGLVKRHELNRFARENGYHVLATGHNLDDEASVLFTNSLSWNSTQLGRQSPVMEEKGLLSRRIKPFVRSYERETTAYALLNQIEYIEEECPFSSGSPTNHYKSLLNGMEHDHPGLKYRYYLTFIENKRSGLLNFSEDRTYEEHICPNCGQATNKPGFCAFCRLVIPEN